MICRRGIRVGSDLQIGMWNPRMDDGRVESPRRPGTWLCYRQQDLSVRPMQPEEGKPRLDGAARPKRQRLGDVVADNAEVGHRRVIKGDRVQRIPPICAPRDLKPGDVGVGADYLGAGIGARAAKGPLVNLVAMGIKDTQHGVHPIGAGMGEAGAHGEPAVLGLDKAGADDACW